MDISDQIRERIHETHPEMDNNELFLLNVVDNYEAQSLYIDTDDADEVLKTIDECITGVISDFEEGLI